MNFQKRFSKVSRRLMLSGKVMKFTSKQTKSWESGQEICAAKNVCASQLKWSIFNLEIFLGKCFKIQNQVQKEIESDEIHEEIQTAGNQEICERFGSKSSDWSIFNLLNIFSFASSRQEVSESSSEGKGRFDDLLYQECFLDNALRFVSNN